MMYTCPEILTSESTVISRFVKKPLHKMMALSPFLQQSEEAGRAEFNVATPTYATVAYSIRYEFTNETHFELLQEGFNVEPQRIFGENIFNIRY